MLQTWSEMVNGTYKLTPETFAYFLLGQFQRCVNDRVCSLYTKVQEECNVENFPHEVEYTNTDIESYMFHWTDEDTPEADGDWISLHSNPFWKWSGTTLFVIKIPKGTKIVALKKYTELDLIEDRIQWITENSDEEFVNKDDQATLIRTLQAMTPNNTHREYRLPYSSTFGTPETEFDSLYHPLKRDAQVHVKMVTLSESTTFAP